MLYRVTKQYARGTDTPVAQFADINDAKLFINEKLKIDAGMKVKVTYRLFESFDLLEEFSESTETGGSTGASSAGAQQRSSFQPTPFNAAPRPAGMPANWLKDEDKKDEGKR
jgi:hypothetical protein